MCLAGVHQHADAMAPSVTLIHHYFYLGSTMATTTIMMQRRQWLLLLIILSVTLCTTFSSSPPPSLLANKHSHTRITGFGSHTISKSIFAGEKTSPHDSKTLQVYQSKKDSSCLYFQAHHHDHQKNTTVCLTISENGELLANTNIPTSFRRNKRKKWIPIDGLYGIYNLPSGIIVVLITGSHEIYSNPLMGQIRRVDSMELLHLPRTTPNNNNNRLKLRQIKEEMRQLKLLRQALRQHDFYYIHHSNNNSTNTNKMDMTQTLQRYFRGRRQEENNNSAWWNNTTTIDSRFFWNEPAVQPLLDDTTNGLSTLLPHVLIVTAAFVGVQTNITLLHDAQQQQNNVVYDELLISRKSRFRAGTRFTKRGADGTGAVANYAETEQLLVCYNSTSKTSMMMTSHVQTRGSIPLRWSSPADVKTYRPRVRIGIDPLAQARALRSHLMEQWSLYDCRNTPQTKHEQIVLVNLIDKHGDQGRLGRAFGAVLDAVLDVYKTRNDNDTRIDSSRRIQQQWSVAPDMIRHVWFDFHAECKGGRYDQLKYLLKDVSSTLDEQGYFCAVPSTRNDNEWNITKLQRGVVRTNCMDCLDRTNVVQSIFGRYMLFRQLQEQPGIAVTTKKRNLPLEYASRFRLDGLSLPWSSGEVAHRLVWADNADAISRLYAGTPALKGDFTRTGKRTKRGALDDGMNSLQRYYLNNFLDADRQEGMDLLVGYADFAIVDDDDDDDGDSLVALDDTEETASSDVRSMSIQEAARAMMLGLPTSSIADDDERSHARIKVNSQGSSRRPLGLRWLPGDLQSHMRSRAAALGDEPILGSKAIATGFSTSIALEAIDRRAASDQPWWVTVDSSDDDEAGEDVESKEKLGTRSANAGHLLGGLVAAFQMPIATAVAVVCMMVPSVWATTQNSEKNKKS